MSADERPSLGARLRRAFWPVSVDHEVDEELAAHLALQTRRFMEAGLDEAAARRAARERFGDMGRVRAECHDIRSAMETRMRRTEWLEELRMDVRFALRGLRRTPLFTAVVVGTMAIAIGASTAIFSVVHAVLLRSLPYDHGDRIDVVWNGNTTTRDHYAVSAPEYFDLAAQLRDHDAVAAISPQPSALVADGGEPERLMAYVTTPNVFDLLGARPALGRAFVGDDGQPDAPRVIVLSHGLWTRRFGADPRIIGKSVSVGGLQRTVVGVMPAEVRFPDAPVGFLKQPADLWIPSSRATSRNDSRGNQVLAVIARRRAGVDDRRAQADVDAVAGRWRADYASRYASESAKGWRLVAVSLRDEMVGSARPALAVVSGAVLLVLLIACINVTNLLVARGAARRHEMGIRTALGAGRARLVRQVLTESIVLSFAGGIVGVLGAGIAVRALVRAGGATLPRIADAALDPTVLAMSVALTTLCGVCVGIVPALRQSQSDVRDTLATRGGDATNGRSADRLRSLLVGAQVAMALVVLVAGGLLVRSFVALTRVEAGFVPDQVMTAQLTVPRARYDSDAKVIAFYDQLLARMHATPGIAAASAGYPLPMSGDGWSGSFSVDGEPDGPNARAPHAEYGVAMPGYFEALGIPLRAGRDFASTDTRDAPRVVIVDELLARQHWPGVSPIGKRVNRDRAGNWATVVGVVAHVRKGGPRNEGEPQLYLPFAQNPQTTLSVVLRSSAGPLAVAAPLRGAVRAVDAQLPVSQLQPYTALVGRATAGERLNAVMLGSFGAVAALLASIGLYGVMAYGVSRRTREIGIRLALGGAPSAIRRMVLGEGIVVVTAGLAVGLSVALLLSRTVSGLLFGVTPTDIATYGAITLLLFVAGLAAAWFPARRATRIDPMLALREE